MMIRRRSDFVPLLSKVDNWYKIQKEYRSATIIYEVLKQ